MFYFSVSSLTRKPPVTDRKVENSVSSSPYMSQHWYLLWLAATKQFLTLEGETEKFKHEFFQGAVQMSKVHISAGEDQIQTGLGHKQTEVWLPPGSICQHHKTITLVCIKLSPQKKNQNGINYYKLRLRCSIPTDRQKVDTICFALTFRQHHANFILQAWY